MYRRRLSKRHDDTAKVAVSSAPLNDKSDIEAARTPDDATLDVSVVIVNYNVREFLEQALGSVVRASSRLAVEIFVVDNNSVDGSVPMVRERFPEVKLIANEDNVGFGVANNMAIEQARGRYVLILNPDTIVQEDTLEYLVSFMDERPEAGAAGCQILNPDGTFAPESRRSFPTPEVAFYRMTGLARFFPQSRTFGRYNMTFLPRDEVAEVDALSGSCMFVRREALLGHASGIGLFDEDFFMYGEDLDLCFRIQEAGWKIYYAPGTQIIHYKGESTKKGEFRYVKLFYGAMVLFTRKHLKNRHSRVFAAILQGAIMARAGVSVASRAASRLFPAATDFALVYLSVVALAWLRSSQLEAPLSQLYLTAVAPAYGLGTVSGVLLSGGYARPSVDKLRPVLTGIVLGFLFVSAASFFAKEIAFSRAVVLGSALAALVLLPGWRAFRRGRSEVRRAILVGEREEAERLGALLGAHPRPPFLLDGFVEPSRDVAAPGERAGTGAHLLGSLHHLRDLVRLHQVDDVVFAVKNVSNMQILRVMQNLQDLPLQFRMLGEGRSHVIGKATISELGLPELDETISEAVRIRDRSRKKLFEWPVALILVLLWPIWSALAAVTKSHGVRALRSAAGRAPAVLAGKADLVGVDPADASLVPPEWQLRPGVFSITQLLQTKGEAAGSKAEKLRAYGYYVTHQSASLDGEIILGALRRS